LWSRGHERLRTNSQGVDFKCANTLAGVIEVQHAGARYGLRVSGGRNDTSITVTSGILVCAAP
jgi:hypothetical protein